MVKGVLDSGDRHGALLALTLQIPIRIGVADRSRMVGDDRVTAIALGAETAAFHAKQHSPNPARPLPALRD